MAEIRGLETHMPEYLGSYLQYIKEEKEGTSAYLIVKLADTVSVLQYSNLELELGNRTSDMISINEGAQERVYKLIERLKEKLAS